MESIHKRFADRQDFLECALDWISKGNIDNYMSLHRKDKNISELKTYFNTVIDWASGVFTDVESEMCGLEWGQFYELYHKKPYNPKKVSEDVKELYADSYIKNRRGVFEYILGGKTDTICLMFVYLTRQQKNQCMQNKHKPQRKKKFQTVRFVQ